MVFGARARLISSLFEKLCWHDCLLNSIDKVAQGAVLSHGKYESADIILESMKKTLSEGGSVEMTNLMTNNRFEQLSQFKLQFRHKVFNQNQLDSLLYTAYKKFYLSKALGLLRMLK